MPNIYFCFQLCCIVKQKNCCWALEKMKSKDFKRRKTAKPLMTVRPKHSCGDVDKE